MAIRIIFLFIFIFLIALLASCASQEIWYKYKRLIYPTGVRISGSSNELSNSNYGMGLLQIDELQGKCKTKILSVYRIDENLSEHLTPQSAICNSPIMVMP